MRTDRLLENRWLEICCSFLLILSTSCAGGTSGTSVIGKRLVKGTVKDSSARGIEGAEMRVSGTSGTILSQSTTDQDGSFQMEAPSSDFTLTIANGTTTASTEVGSAFAPPSTLGVNVTLAADGSLQAQRKVEVKASLSSVCETDYDFDGRVFLRTVERNEPCRLRLRALDNGRSAAGKAVEVRERCAGQERANTRSLDRAGELEIELLDFSLRGCSSLSIVVFPELGLKTAPSFEVQL